MQVRSWVDESAFHAVATQNISHSMRRATPLSIGCITITSSATGTASKNVDVLVELLLRSLRASDTVGRLGPDEVAVVLPGTRRLDAYDVLLEIGRIVDREELLEEGLAIHVGIGEVDPAFPAPEVLDLLDVARKDVQMPPVRWPSASGDSAAS